MFDYYENELNGENGKLSTN